VGGKTDAFDRVIVLSVRFYALCDVTS